jgi:hypothetical protein
MPRSSRGQCSYSRFYGNWQKLLREANGSSSILFASCGIEKQHCLARRAAMLGNYNPLLKLCSFLAFRTTCARGSKFAPARLRAMSPPKRHKA